MCRDVSGDYFITLSICLGMMMVCSLSFGMEPIARKYMKKQLKKSRQNGYHAGPDLKVQLPVDHSEDREVEA